MVVHFGMELSLDSDVQFHHFGVACHSLDSNILHWNNLPHLHPVPPSQVQVIPHESPCPSRKVNINVLHLPYALHCGVIPILFCRGQYSECKPNCWPAPVRGPGPPSPSVTQCDLPHPVCTSCVSRLPWRRRPRISGLTSEHRSTTVTGWKSQY